jgi:hypothetical protein
MFHALFARSPKLRLAEEGAATVLKKGEQNREEQSKEEKSKKAPTYKSKREQSRRRSD